MPSFRAPMTAALVIVAILALSYMAMPVSAAGASIATRIDNVGSWLGGQLLTSGGVVGFAHGNGADSVSTRMLTAENSVVALALVSYHDTRNSDRFDPELDAATAFLLSAQTNQYDFYQYFDSSLNSWKKSGRLYGWNSFAIMSLAYAAYTMSVVVPTERAHWLDVGRAAERTIERWRSANADATGAWSFYNENGTKTARIDDNGALLAGISYLALLEYRFGSNTTSQRLSSYAQPIAGWLVTQQETNSTSWGYGGLYTDASRSSQEFAANCLAFFGINSYYKVIGLLSQKPTPSLETVRVVMVDWMDAFVNAMVDLKWGPLPMRAQSGLAPYPKLAWTAGWLMRATADIWINIGTLQYQTGTGQIYEWLTGMNELSLDLQVALNRLGQPGGFIRGIDEGKLANVTDTLTSASAMFGMLQGNLISIFEFQNQNPPLAVMLILGIVPIVARRCKK